MWNVDANVAGWDRKVGKEAGAEMFLSKGEGTWHFLSTSTRPDAELGGQYIIFQ